MRCQVGTSGYQYRAWRGSFYSERCREADMLAEYGRLLPTVEVNSSFYRMPKPDVLSRWRTAVPEHFRFAIKASQRISHRKRLKDCAEPVEYLLSVLRSLGEKLGTVLVQLPPTMRRDDERLATFLSLWPDDVRVAMEFRHESWFDEGVFERLREHRAALCIADVEGEELAARLVATADHGYLRLRRDTYDDAGLDAIAALTRAQSWDDVSAYLKHEDVGPALAAGLLSRLSA